MLSSVVWLLGQVACANPDQARSGLRTVQPVAIEVGMNATGSDVLQVQGHTLAEQLVSAAEHRMAENGIPVDPRSERVFSIEISGSRSHRVAEADETTVRVSASLSQLARLEDGVNTIVRTWERYRVGVSARQDDLAHVARAEVFILVEEFSNHYGIVGRR